MVKGVKAQSNGVSLKEIKQTISETFKQQTQLLVWLSNIPNPELRTGLLLRCLSLQAQQQSTLLAALAAAGVPEDVITKTLTFGDNLAAVGVKDAIQKLKDQIAAEGQPTETDAQPQLPPVEGGAG